jgi:PAS domain S-box-containing protein
MKNVDKSEVLTLRQKSEEQLKKQQSKVSSPSSESDIRKLNHELQVHQIELEIQNEELCLAKKQEEIAIENYTELLNFTPACYYKLSKNGEIIYLNLSGTIMLGKTSHRLINSSFGFFVSNDTKQSFNLFLRNVFSSKTKQLCEVTLLDEGIVPKTVLLIGLISENSEQCYVNLVDISERKKLELALEEREKEFRTLAESMPQIVWTTRADGWNTYFNQQWVDYTGLTLEESYGHGWNTPFHPEDKQRGWDAWQNAVKNNAEYSIECRLRCHDGTYHWWLIRGVPQISARGEIIKWFGTCTDIEKIKVAELALKESEKQLLRLSVDKDRFISILGHDLKNPFNNILGFSEILTDEIERLDKEQIKDIAGTINKSARITNKLLEDILMWAKTQQGSIVFKPQNLSLSTTFRNSLEILNPSADAKNILINCSEVDHLDVFADADMLKTVLRNLVSNAIKFTNNGGKINISATQSDSNVTISVSDNGVGIPHENLAKLFDITEVFTTKGTAGETGTGLGLLLCKEFVGRHQGKIWVESEVGKGSDFKFTLPVNI